MKYSDVLVRLPRTLDTDAPGITIQDSRRHVTTVKEAIAISLHEVESRLRKECEAQKEQGQAALSVPQKRHRHLHIAVGEAL